MQPLVSDLAIALALTLPSMSTAPSVHNARTPLHATIAINAHTDDHGQETKSTPQANRNTSSTHSSGRLDSSQQFATINRFLQLPPKGYSTQSWKPTYMKDGGGGKILRSYPQVSRKEGCRRAKLGKWAFRIAYNGLMCIPVGAATGSLAGFGCGLLGSYVEDVIPCNNVC